MSVEIHDVSDGKLMYSQQFGNQSGVLQLNVAGLQYGVYVLHLKMNNTEKIFKIIKQ
ncbi:MAG: T9SS type A sorting domain-containing protein [Bacteroidetes bacterium]|nr:T9SS type A sorting domain-containing protein [Bacteroidota bacterium]